MCTPSLPLGPVISSLTSSSEYPTSTSCEWKEEGGGGERGSLCVCLVCGVWCRLQTTRTMTHNCRLFPPFTFPPLLICLHWTSCIPSLSYSPGPSEVLKWAWVQYVSVFLVIAFLLDRMNSFVFTHKVGALRSQALEYLFCSMCSWCLLRYCSLVDSLLFCCCC